MDINWGGSDGGALASAFAAGCGDVGIWAIRGSTIMAQNAVSSSADDSANSLGSGFAAEYASAIDASGAEAHNCWLAGFTSYTSSSIRAYAASSHDNTNDGVRVGWNGSIDFNTGATIEDNGGYGFRDVDGTGSWYAATPTLSGNVLGDYSKPLDLSTANALRVNRQYLDIRGYSDYAILRYLVDGTERARSEYRHDLGRYDVSVGSEIVMRAYTAGRTTIGPGAPATNATNVLQIPAMAGAPVGSPSVDTGYVPIVFDTTNNKLWVYDGGWIGTVLS